MKSMLQTACLILLFIFTFFFFPVSCASRAAMDRFEYTKTDFEAKIVGLVNDKELSAIIQSRPNASGNDPKLTVRFTSPESLEGICVTLDASGKCSVRFGEIYTDTDGLDKFIEPFAHFMIAREIHSVQRNDDGTEFVKICDENCDLIYVFSKNSRTPSRVYGKYYNKNINFEIQDFSFDFDSGK